MTGKGWKRKYAGWKGGPWIICGRYVEGLKGGEGEKKERRRKRMNVSERKNKSERVREKPLTNLRGF